MGSFCIIKSTFLRGNWISGQQQNLRAAQLRWRVTGMVNHEFINKHAPPSRCLSFSHCLFLTVYMGRCQIGLLAVPEGQTRVHFGEHPTTAQSMLAMLAHAGSCWLMLAHAGVNGPCCPCCPCWPMQSFAAVADSLIGTVYGLI